MTENSQTRQVTRRQALRGAGALTAGAAASLAGCSVPFLGSSDPVLDVKIRPLSMLITVDKDADVDRISVYPPEGGKPIKTVEMTPGRQKIVVKTVREGIPFGLRLVPPGDYRIAAGRGGKTIAEQTVTLEPKPEITNIGVQRFNDLPGCLHFTLTNHGTLPASMNHISISGTPTYADADANAALSRRDEIAAPQDRLASLPDIVSTMVVPNSKGKFVTVGPPFGLGEDDYNKYTKGDESASSAPTPCQTKQWNATLSLKFVYNSLSQPFAYSFGGKTMKTNTELAVCSEISLQPIQNTSSGNNSS